LQPSARRGLLALPFGSWKAGRRVLLDPPLLPLEEYTSPGSPAGEFSLLCTFPVTTAGIFFYSL